MPMATKLAFEVFYHDNSGVEHAVRYGQFARYDEGRSEVIEIERHGDTVCFDVAQRDFLLDSLNRIKQELFK